VRGTLAPRSYVPAWAWLSVPVATGDPVDTGQVAAGAQRQHHAAKRSCRQNDTQDAVKGRLVAIADVLQGFHGRSYTLSLGSVQVAGSAQRRISNLERL